MKNIVFGIIFISLVLLLSAGLFFSIRRDMQRIQFEKQFQQNCAQLCEPFQILQCNFGDKFTICDSLNGPIVKQND